MNEQKPESRRGTIARIPGTAPGIIVGDGGEWTFTLQTPWSGAAGPVAGQAVEFALDGQGHVIRMTGLGARQVVIDGFCRTTDAAANWVAGSGKEKLLQTTDKAVQWAKGPGQRKARAGLAGWLAWEGRRPEFRRDGNHLVYGDAVAEFHVLHAEIVGSEKRSETRVSGGGGGGSIHTVGGHVSGYTAPVHVSSSVSRTHEIWLRKPDGSERAMTLSHHGVQVRPSNAVTLISYSRPDWNVVYDAVLVNRTSGQHWKLVSPKEMNKRLRIERGTGVSLLVAAGIFGLFAAPAMLLGLQDGTRAVMVAGAWLAGGYLVYRVIRRAMRRAAVHKRLADHVEELAQEAYASQA